MAYGVASGDHGSRACIRFKSPGMACGFLPIMLLLLAGLSLLVLAASQRRWLSSVPRQSIGLVEVMPVANVSDAYYAAYIVSADRPSMCLHLYWEPSDGAKLRVWDCPVDKDLITKFLLPIGGHGPIRLLSNPRFCLDAPGNGVLQLWTCVGKGAGKAANLNFHVNAEKPAWFKYPHFDLPNVRDVEQMDASDLHEVMRHAQEKGYAGFSVFKNKAFLKGAKTMETTELLYMGVGDPCTFYMFRPQGDITFRLARKTSQCIHVSPGLRQPMLGMASCDDSNADASQVLARRFGIRHIGVDEETRKRVQDVLKPLHLHYVGERVDRPHTEPPTTTFTTTQRGTSTTDSTTSSSITTRSPAGTTVGDAGSAVLRAKASGSLISAAPGIQHATMTSVVILVRNVDYGLLLAKRPLYTQFGQTVSECVAAAAGVASNAVTWKLRAGSVLVVNSISAPEGMHPSVLHSRLEESRMTLSHHIVARLHRMVGIEDVTTGNLSVSEVRPLGGTVPPGPPVRLDVLSAALILLVAAAVWLWCRVCASRNKEETTKGSEQQQTEPLLTDISVNKSPGPGELVTPESGSRVTTDDVVGNETPVMGPSSASTASREAEEQDHAAEEDHSNPFEYESGEEENEQDESRNPFDVQGLDNSHENPFDAEALAEDKELQRRGR